MKCSFGRQSQKAAALALALALGAAAPHAARAHEMSPAIADLALDHGAPATLTLQINLEAVLAGLGPDHDSAEDGPQSERYNALRALPGDALADEARSAAPEIVAIAANGAPVAVGQPDIAVPAPPEADVPRTSRLDYTFALPAGTDRLEWRFVPRYAPSVVRVREPGADSPGFAELVSPDASAVVTLSAPLRGARPVASWAAGGLAVLLALGALVLWRRRAA